MILVTGATGFVGKELVSALIKKGYRVRVLCRKRKGLGRLASKVDVRIGDITKKESLKNVCRGVDTVIHLAGTVSYTNPKEEIFETNVKGTENLLNECGKVKKIIFSSSVSVYGKTERVADEKHPLAPETAYGESKRAAEGLVIYSGIKYVILRIAPVYGEKSPVWKKNMKLLERGFPIPDTKNVTHVVHVSDVVQAFEKSVKRGEGAYNIAGKSPVKFVDFAMTLAKSLGKRPRVLPFFIVKLLAAVSGMGKYLDVLTMNRRYSIEKARKGLGYAPRADFGREVRKMAEWYRKVS